jgi:preprotein translocase subunit SecE
MSSCRRDAVVTKEKVAASGMWLSELFQFGVYKRSQGRIARQVTFAAMAITFALAAWRFYVTFGPSLPSGVGYASSAVVLLLGLWVSFRLVNVPRFADFLIAVEAEMNKVSWPSRTELIRSSVVVIFVIFFLSVVLFGFDLTWGFLFEWMGIIKAGK